MKTALAIVCSLLLAWTFIVPVSATGASVVSSAPSCCCGSGASCCSANTPTPESQPVSATPVLTFSHAQLVTVLGAAFSWDLPQIESQSVPPSLLTTHAPSVPLFERHCVFLI